MLQVIKILLFLIVNLAGYFTIPILVNLTIMLGIYPQMPTMEMQQTFNEWLMGIGVLVWLVAAFISIAYFFVQDKYTRVWVILAPIWVTFLYGVGVMLYFNYAPLPAA